VALQVLHHQKVDALMTAVPAASADRISSGPSLGPEVTAISVRHYSPAERWRLPYKGLAADVTALGVRSEPPRHNSWIVGHSETTPLLTINRYSLTIAQDCQVKNWHFCDWRRKRPSLSTGLGDGMFLSRYFSATRFNVDGR
jgi:hypothetical protein